MWVCSESESPGGLRVRPGRDGLLKDANLPGFKNTHPPPHPVALLPPVYGQVKKIEVFQLHHKL